MGCCAKLVSFGVVVVAIAVGSYLYYHKQPLTPDYYRNDHYWGAKQLKPGAAIPVDNTQIRKFAVNVDDSVLEDLKARLANTRITPSFEGTNFEYGFHSDALKKLINYWQNSFSWRKQEKYLNKHEHFKTQIEGLDIHFIHVKPSKPAKEILPLLLVHGWPGSVWEFYKMIPLLTEPSNGIAFELIIPSIPGFAWSEASHKPDFDIIHTGRIFDKLMKRLGHSKYYYHGGDWGAAIGKALASLFPDHVLGLHTSFPIAKVTPCTVFKIALGSLFPSYVFDNPEVDVKKVYPVAQKISYLLKETGYAHIQSTKPDTIGAALSDSPAGLAAYLLEKFSTYTNYGYVNRADGGLTEKYTYDELLTNVMIYWTTNSITTSQRTYKENFGQKMFIDLDFDGIPVPSQVPVGVAALSEEVLIWPKTLLSEVFKNITHYKDIQGGHFASVEVPNLLADDIKTFVKSIRK